MAVMGLPGGSAGKESACDAEVLGSIPGLGRSPAEEKGYPIQYSGLENSMDYIVHGVTKSQTRLNKFHKGGDGNLLQKDLCHQATAPRTIVFSAPDPAACHC